MFRRIFTPKKTINFLSHSKVAAVFSTLLLIVSLAVWFVKKDDKYGIDYKGGYEIIVKFNGDGYKTADELDRLNDLHELSKDEVKQLDWYDAWWKKVGAIGQDWLIEH